MESRVGKKYIIEISDELILLSPNGEVPVHNVYKIKNFTDMYLDDIGLAKLDTFDADKYYVEADIVRAQNDAYNDGFSEGYKLANTNEKTEHDTIALFLPDDDYRVGDVVHTPSSGDQIILKVLPKSCICINFDGSVYMFPKTSLKHTESHFDELSSMLNSLNS